MAGQAPRGHAWRIIFSPNEHLSQWSPFLLNLRFILRQLASPDQTTTSSNKEETAQEAAHWPSTGADRVPHWAGFPRDFPGLTSEVLGKPGGWVTLQAELIVTILKTMLTARPCSDLLGGVQGYMFFTSFSRSQSTVRQGGGQEHPQAPHQSL